MIFQWHYIWLEIRLKTYIFWSSRERVDNLNNITVSASYSGCFGRVSDDIMTDSSPLISPTAKISYDEGKVDLYSCTENLNVTWDVLLG